MAVDERGDQPAVDVAGDGDVKPLRLEDRDRFVSVPVALQLVPVFVEPPAAEAVGQLVGIVVLKCLPLHRMLRSRPARRLSLAATGTASGTSPPWARPPCGSTAGSGSARSTAGGSPRRGRKTPKTSPPGPRGHSH